MVTKEKLTDNENKILSFIAGMIIGVIAVMILIYGLTGNNTKSGSNNANRSELDLDTETVISEEASSLQQEIFTVTEPVIVKNLSEEISVQQPYNGEVLEDNGKTYAIKVNRQENVITVYTLDDDGYYTIPVKAMSCSTAEGDGTPKGIYKTSSRYRWAYLQGDVCGQYAYRIVDHILFHSVPYLDTEEDTLETWEYNKLGTDASMGCVRLCVADAKWIYENCETGTQVEIFDSDYVGPMGRPCSPYIFDIEAAEDIESLMDYDPTDMAEGNPYAGKLALYGAENHHISVNEPYDAMAGIMAFNADMEDITDKIQVSGNVDNQVPGCYEVTYYVSDDYSVITKTIVIIVDDTSIPIIVSAPEDITIELTSDETNEEAFYNKLKELLAAYITVKDNGIICLASNIEENCSGLQFFSNVYNCKPEAGTYYADIYMEDAAGNVSETISVGIIIK